MRASLLFWFPVAMPHSSGAQEDVVASALVAARTTIEVGADGPRGDGLDFLRRELAASQHFLIGETHGTAETPELVGWILPLAKEAGYSTLFLETGPISQEMANELLAAPEGLDRLAAFLDENFMGIAFLNWEGEAVLAADALADGWTVAGLDQEFIASGRHLLARLESLAPSDDARARVRAPLEAERELARRFRRTGDRSIIGGVFLGSAPSETFDALDAAFAGAPPEAARLLAEMRRSADVYRAWSSGRNYESNRLRVELMKGHLREHVATELDGDWPRLRSVSKFGGFHCARGLNSNRQYDLGTHLSELAEASGSRSFHLLVLAQENETPPGIAPSGTSGPWLEPLFRASADADWTILDVRPLRALAHDSGAIRQREMLDLVFGFDAVAVAPRFTAAVELVPR